MGSIRMSRPLVAAWRAARNLDRSASVDDARAADPAGWAVLEADLVAIVIGIGITLATLFVAIRFRDKDGTRNPKQTHGNSVLEIG